MTLIRRNKIWHWQTRVDGKTIRRSTHESDKRSAQRKAQTFRAELLLRKRLSSNSPPATLAETILAEVARVEADVGTRQAERVRICLLNFEEWIGEKIALEALPADTLTRYQRHRLATASRATVQKEIHAIGRMLRGKTHNVEKPPALGRGRFAPNRAFTEAEVQAIFARATGWMRDLCLVLATTGARPAEIIPSYRSNHIALLKTEVDYEAQTITLRTAKQKAGQTPAAPRTVKVPQETLDACKRQTADTLGVHVFAPGNANLARQFKALLRRAGVPRIDALGRKATLHSWRHTYATRIAQIVGQNPFLLQRALGHSQIGTTAQYCHPTAPAIVLNSGGVSTNHDTEGCQKGCQNEKSA